MASTVPSIRIVKTTPYKNGLKTWSNRYAFTGGTPADLTHWTTLANAVVTAEKATHASSTTIVEAVGYAAGSEVPVATIVYSTAGTLTAAAGGTSTPLECAVLTRWSTSARSTKNHPIYAFSYTHQAIVDSTQTYREKVDANQKSALETYATAWITGFSDGTITAKRSTPQGHVATGSIVEEYTTHRDFPFQSSV